MVKVSPIPNSSQAGSILIITLCIISLLVVLVTETMRRMQVEQASATLFSGTFQGQALNRSGLALIKQLLTWDSLNQEHEVDHYGEPWGRFPEQDEVQLPDLDELQMGHLNATIRDEQGKFPINSLLEKDGTWSAAHKQVFERLLQNPPFALEQELIDKLMPRLKDWMDADHQPTGVYGAEKDTYALEERNATCRNGPLLSSTELLLIKEMPRKLITGTTDQPGLQDLISVHTRERININTAPFEILAAMVSPGTNPETTLEFVGNMLEYRKDPMHFDFLFERDWYRNRMAGFNDIQLPADLVTTSSDTFALLFQSTVGGFQVSSYMLLKRKKTQEKVIFDSLLTEVN